MDGVRLDRVQRGIFEAMKSALEDTGVVNTVCWSYQQQERVDDESILTLELTAGPTAGHREGAHYDTIIKPPTSVIVQVHGLEVGRRALVWLNGFAHYYDIQAGDTKADVRDALLASIQDQEAEFVTATASGTARILLSATFPKLWGLYTGTPGTWSAENILYGDGVFTGAAASVTTGIELAQLTVNAYSKNLELRNGARTIAEKARAALRTRDVVDVFARYGAAIGTRGPVIPLNAIAGANFETRAAASVDLRLESYIVKPTDTIETVNFGTLTFYSAPNSSPFTETLSVAAP